jgi:hypothetical protein
MIRAFCKLALVAALAATFTPVAASAALMADPNKLYAEMKDAYAKDEAAGWSFRAQEYYLSTIFNAGRAYSLQYPTDPNYAVLATLTVQIGSGLHYNPLTNHDAAVWWVREAADWVTKNSQDPALISQANAILARVNAEDDPESLARFADEDATANLTAYPKDVDAMLIQVEANWRAWVLTRDASWRSLAFQRAAAPDFPVAHLPTTWGNELVAAAQRANAGQDGYTDGDVHNAEIFLARLKAVDPLRVITTVTAMPHDAYLSTLAPADEYFGKLGMSILGIENELKHINFMLDYNYGNRESGATVSVADAIDGMQHVYPRDRDLPMLLYWCYTTARRMDDDAALRTAAHLKAILTVEYEDSPQARKILSPQ